MHEYFFSVMISVAHGAGRDRFYQKDEQYLMIMTP